MNPRVLVGLSVLFALAGPPLLTGAETTLLPRQTDTARPLPPPRTAGEVRRVSGAELRRRIPAGEVVPLDVRTAREFQGGHLPGARHVELAGIPAHLADLRRAAERRVLVAYCSCPAEHLAVEVALALVRRGVTNVAVLAGGYVEWVRESGPVEYESLPPADGPAVQGAGTK